MQGRRRRVFCLARSGALKDFRKCTYKLVLVHEAPEKAANTHEKAPQRRLAIDLHRRAATRCRRAAPQAHMIDLANGQPAPSEAATRRRAAACPRRRRAGRDAAFLVKTTYCCSTPAAIASRGARQAETAPTNGRPKAARVASPRRRRALIRGTRYWQLARPANARRACRSGRHLSQDASVGEGCVRC